MLCSYNSLFLLCSTLTLATPNFYPVDTLILLCMLSMMSHAFFLTGHNNTEIWNRDYNLPPSFGSHCPNRYSMDSIKYLPFKQLSSGSIYITICMSVERYLTVCHPFFKFYHNWRMDKFIVPASMFSLLFNIPKYLEFNVQDLSSPENLSLAVLVPSKLR